MVDILHRVGVKSSPDDVFEALTTTEGLSGWWTTDTQGDGDVGRRAPVPLRRRRLRHERRRARSGKRVLWEVVDGPEEWIGTHVSWDLRQEDDWTTVLFRHQGWKEPVEFMHHCSTKWAVFLMSLKSLLETGQGAPIRTTSRSTTGTDGDHQRSCYCSLPEALTRAC